MIRIKKLFVITAIAFPILILMLFPINSLWEQPVELVEDHEHPFDSEYIVDDETQRQLLYQGYKWYDGIGWIHPDEQYKYDNPNEQ